MKYLGVLMLMYAMAATASAPEAGFDLRSYTVIPLHRGINSVNVGVDGQIATVVIGHRENFNAHSFNVVTFYLSPARTPPGSTDPWPELNIVGLFETRADGGFTESQFLTDGGGADCVVHDFRLLRSSSELPPVLVIASRPVTHSYADADPVTFSYYTLTRNIAEEPGRPEYWFKLVDSQMAAKQYCDVGDALNHELGLPDYRVPPVLR